MTQAQLHNMDFCEAIRFFRDNGNIYNRGEMDEFVCSLVTEGEYKQAIKVLKEMDNEADYFYYDDKMCLAIEKVGDLDFLTDTNDYTYY